MNLRTVWLPAALLLAVCSQSWSAGWFEPLAQDDRTIAVYWGQQTPPLALERDGEVIASIESTSGHFRDTSARPGVTHSYRLTGATASGEVLSERLYDTPDQKGIYDVVVVGGSASGVGAAVSAARRGVRVLLIEDSTQPGGMITNGVSATDLRVPARANGLFEEFRRLVQQHYGTGNGLTYEPKVALRIIKGLVRRHPNIHMAAPWRLENVHVERGRIVSARFRSLRDSRYMTVSGRVWIDATPDGAMLPMTGTPYRFGRESRSEREPHAGHIILDRAADLYLPGSTGKGDDKLQSFAYLLALRDYGEGNQAPLIAMPPHYDPANYQHTPPFRETWAHLYGRFPGSKLEMNQHPQGNGLQEINHRWLSMSQRERDAVAQRYRDHALGYLYYMQNVMGLTHIGLAEDEYPDNGNIPHVLYVRGARRLQGLVTMDQSDVWLARVWPREDAVAIGDYPMDSHAVHRKTDWTTPDLGEGEFWLFRQTPWYSVPWGVLVPKSGPVNLLVSTAVSSTHVGYGTLRMEPVRMNMGQAAGAAAVLMALGGVTAKQVPVHAVQEMMWNDDVLLAFHPDLPARGVQRRAIQFLSIRGAIAEERCAPDSELTNEQLARWFLCLARPAGRTWIYETYAQLRSAAEECGLRIDGDAQAPVNTADVVAAAKQLAAGDPLEAVRMSAINGILAGTKYSGVTRGQAAVALYLARYSPGW